VPVVVRLEVAVEDFVVVTELEPVDVQVNDAVDDWVDDADEVSVRVALDVAEEVAVVAVSVAVVLADVVRVEEADVEPLVVPVEERLVVREFDSDVVAVDVPVVVFVVAVIVGDVDLVVVAVDLAVVVPVEVGVVVMHLPHATGQMSLMFAPPNRLPQPIFGLKIKWQFMSSFRPLHKLFWDLVTVDVADVLADEVIVDVTVAWQVPHLLGHSTFKANC